MTKNLTRVGTDTHFVKWEPPCFFGKTNPSELLHQKLKGLYGYGPRIFTEQDSEPLLFELEKIYASLERLSHLKTDELTDDLAKLILGVSHHVEYQSFQSSRQKESDTWEQIRNLANQINELSHLEMATLLRFIIDPVERQARTDPIITMASALEDVATELRLNRRTGHPTKQERLLQLFQSQPNFEARLEELAPIFAGGLDPERLAQQKISELNSKLESYGIQIERSPLYHIVLKNDKSRSQTD